MEDTGDPAFTLATVLILAALGMFAWNSAPLQSARPGSHKSSWYEHSRDDQVPARLWQDPFRAVHDYQNMGRQQLGEPSGQALLRDVIVRSVRSTADSGHPSAKTPLVQEIPRSLDKEGESAARELIILVAMVSPGFYPELEENRRQRRYAVLSGLSDSGFVPRSPESLSLFRVSAAQLNGKDPESPESSTSSRGAAENSLTIPYEWYDLDKVGSDPKPLVVLWLDESRLGDAPFVRIRSLVEGLVPSDPAQRARISWIMLGPNRSGTLRSMVNEAKDREGTAIKNLSNSALKAFYILSPSATVDDCELDPTLPRCVDRGQATANAPSDLLGDYFTADCPQRRSKGTCMRFLRTVRSDADLIKGLSEELVTLRGVGRYDTVVTLSEWDTYFGRSLPRALESALQKFGPSEPTLVRYTYERGIDGMTAAEAPVRAEASSDKISKNTDRQADGKPETIRRPVGTAQFDYLRRLAEVVRDEDLGQRADTGHGVKAVAVLGSDVYDKLLILRALRSQLPGATWVTTDLNANLLHPEEFPWTRNLIVASTYDLHLPQGLQPSTPPFRTSYQTSVYLATRLAVEPGLVRQYWRPGADVRQDEPFPGQRAFYDSVPPMLFEVGRYGPVRLSKATKTRPCAEEDLTVPITREHEISTEHYYVGGLLLAVLGIFAIHQLRPRSGRIVLTLGAGLVVAAIVTLVAGRMALGGEPLAIRAGVSVWPTVFIRLAGLGIAFVFIWSTLRRLRLNWEAISYRYFGGPPSQADDRVTLPEALRRAFSVRCEAWLLGTLVLLVTLMVTMRWARGWDTGALATLVAKVAILLILGGLWWAFIYGRILPGVKVRSINRWMTQPSRGAATMLWQTYADYGEPQHRILRSVATTLLYFAGSTIIFGLLGSGASPCRGPAACAINGVVLAAGVIVMLFLLFLVVDAIRLCVNWIEKFVDPSLEWSAELCQRISEKTGLPRSHAPYYVMVHVIAERTREVGRLLYYPLVIVLLMLLARSTYFDDWSLPWALVIVVGLYFSIALAAAATLNLTATKARADILERLRIQGRRLQAEAAGPAAEPAPGQIQQLIDQLEAVRVGAYERIWGQPLARAAALLLTGLGLTYLDSIR